ncbi:hypothetical protein NPIL_434601 [Nephila pilipes]|uniref:Uncharacterized protein n=1 Tax=Nephila pilipes TaxID=299642 RepID=A0A8X6PC61_NEPPI|nr:hypothetical protein NPIL_434601 [Nephila pilipes]
MVELGKLEDSSLRSTLPSPFPSTEATRIRVNPGIMSLSHGRFAVVRDWPHSSRLSSTPAAQIYTKIEKSYDRSSYSALLVDWISYLSTALLVQLIIQQSTQFYIYPSIEAEKRAEPA